MNGLSYVPEINGVEYGWGNIAVMLSTKPVTGITKISYGDEQVIENVYGAGLQPVGRGYGKISPSATIGLYRSEVEAIRKSSPTGRLQDIAPFDIVVQYIPAQGQAPVKHVILGAQFVADKAEFELSTTAEHQDYELRVAAIKRK